MEELYNQLLTQGKIPKGVTLQDFMAVANDPQTSDALFQKLGVDKPTDQAVSRNPVTGTVVDFNRGVVVNEGIKDVRADLSSAEKNYKRSKNTLNSRGQEFKPQKSDLAPVERVDYTKELKDKQDRYLASIEALGETGTDAYMKEQGPDELVEKFNNLGGDVRAAYELYDGTYKQAVGDINKGVDIIIGRLNDSHSNYSEFNKEKAGFNSLSDSQKQEFSKKYQNILEDPNYKSLNKLSDNYNFLSQENTDKKSLLRQADPEYYDKLATEEEIYKDRDYINDNTSSVTTGFLGRTLGRTIKGIGSIATTLGADASGVYRFGKDIEGYFPNSSKAEGPAQSYNKEFDFGGRKYTAVYENRSSNTPLFYRDEEGYIVDSLPPGLQEANESSTNERKVTLNKLPIISQTADVLADISIDAVTGKIIGGAAVKTFKLADKGAKLAYAVGTSIPAYSRVYSQSYYEMLKDPNISADDANSASIALGLAAAAIERINPVESRIAQQGFDNFVTNFSRANAARVAAGEITTKDLVKEFSLAATKFLGGGAKETLEEVTESAFEQNIVNPKINERNKSELTEGMSNSDIANTAIISFAAGSLADLGSLNVKKSKMTLDALGAIIESPNLYEAWIDGVRSTDPELADRIDKEVAPLIQEAGVYDNIENKSKLAEKLLEIRKVEKDLKASSVPEVREAKKLELTKIHNEILKITDEARAALSTVSSENLGTDTVQEQGGNTVTPVVEPTKEEQLQDINKGNIATFTYNNESEVPDILKDKISSTGETNGVPFVRVSIAKNLADFLLANENINSEQSGQSLGNNATANITGDLTTEEGNVNPSSTLESSTETVEDFIVDLSARTQIEITLGSVGKKVDNGEDVSTAEIQGVLNPLYELYDKVDTDASYTQEQKDSAKALIETEISKLENYEFETENETGTVTKTRTIKLPKPIGTKDKGLASKYLPTANRFAEQGTTTLTDKDGNTTTALFEADAEGGLQVTPLEQESFYTMEGGKKVQVREVNGEFKVVNKDGSTSKRKAPQRYTDQINKNRKKVEGKGSTQLSANTKLQEVLFDDNGSVRGAILEDNGNTVEITDPELALDYAIMTKIDEIGDVPEAIFQEEIQQFQEKITPKYVKPQNAQKQQETQTVQEEVPTINQEAQGPTNQTNAQTGSEIEGNSQSLAENTNNVTTNTTAGNEQVQIENFGVAKDEVKPVLGIISQIFDTLKKSGLTTAKNIGDWLNIGVGKEKSYSLKINGEDVQVKNVQPEVVNGFYSQLEKIISTSKQDKLPVKQWIDKFGKSEEAKWTGLTDWLNQQTGSVSKSDIQQYLKDNRIQVVEVVKDMSEQKMITSSEENYLTDTLMDDYDYLGMASVFDAKEAIVNNENWVEKYNITDKKLIKIGNKYRDSINAKKGGTPKFETYQLEGEKENYKEVLVTLPKDKGLLWKQNKAGLWAYFVGEKQVSDGVPDDTYKEIARKTINTRDIIESKKADFKSSHFDEPNILVHLRMNTRTDAEGKKVLFLEEVQSDWGQKGKKEGFETPEKKDKLKKLQDDASAATQKFNEIEEELNKQYSEKKKEGESRSDLRKRDSDFNKLAQEYAPAEQKMFDSRRAFDMFQVDNRGEVPTAPFVTDTNAWTKLGLKVALKEAVKQGADKIAWSTGEQQNERYDLSKQVQSISYEKKSKEFSSKAQEKGQNLYSLYIETKESGYEQFDDLTISEVEGYVGKDIANKIQNNEGNKENLDTSKGNKKVNKLTGIDLKVGGKGMKGFYGSPTEGSLGIVGNVAKSLFKQEPKTVTIKGGKGSIDATSVDAIWVEDNGKVLPENKREDYKFNDNEFVFTIDNNVAYRLYDKNDIKDAKNRDVYTIPRGNYFTQHSIDITPELKAQAEEGQPLFKNAEAQYRIENGKNIIEAIKNFNGSKKAVVALTHEIIHPTVVAIIDGAKSKNKVGFKHARTIAIEYNKANPNNKVTVQELIEDNDNFKEGKTSDKYRDVQEFIASSWEIYQQNGAKGFNKSFQDILNQITEIFRSVYKSISGKDLTPELIKMFDEILGKDTTNEQVQGNTTGGVTTPSQPTESTTGQVSKLATQPTGTVTGSELGNRGQTSETVQEELSNGDNVQVLEESVEGPVKQTKAQKAKEEFKDNLKDFLSDFGNIGIAWDPKSEGEKTAKLLKSLIKYLRAEAVDTIEGIKDFITKQTDGKIEVNTAGATYILQVLQRPDRFGQMMQRAIAADPSIEERVIDHERRPAVTDIEVTALAQDVADNVDSKFLEAALELDAVRREKETGLAEAWPVIAMAMLSKKARDFGDLQAAADIAVILDKIFTDMGSTLRLANSRLLGKYIAVVKAEMLYHQNQDRIAKLDDNDQSISGNIDSVEEVPTADEVFGEIEADLDKASEQVEEEGIAPETEEVVVTPQTISNRSKAKEHLDKARKLMRKLMGQANSGIDPAMFEIGKELFLAAYYETKHRYSSVKASFKKMASDIGVPTNIIPNLFQEVINSPEFSNQQKELIVEEFKKRIDNIGQGKVIGVNKDPIQMVINQMVNAYRIRAKANEDPKAQFIKDYNNNTLKIQDVTNAIKATVTLLNLDSNQREFIKARLEDQLSTLLDKPIGKNQIRRKLNSVAAKQAVKEIIAGRFSGIQKDAFIQGIADQLISDYGFDVAEAQKYEKVVKDGVARMLGQKSEGSEYSRAQRMYLQGLGLNKGKLQKEVEAITKELEGTMTVTERNRLTAKRKRIENILGDLENRIDNALAKGSPSIQKLIDTISSGLMTKPHIAAALSAHYKIGVLTANDLQNLQDAADRYAAAIDNRGRQEAEREITGIIKNASRNADAKFADLATSYMYSQMLSGFDTPLKAVISSLYNMALKAWTEDALNLVGTAMRNPKLAAKQWEFIFGGMADGVEFLRKVGLPKIVSVYRGRELNTDITTFDYDNIQAQVDLYQAKLEKALAAKITPDLKGVVKLAAKLYTTAFLYGQLFYSKTVIAADILTKSLFFPYAVKREVWYGLKDQFEGNLDEMQKEITKIYARDYSVLKQDYVNLGYDETEAANRLSEQKLVDDISSNNETIQAAVKSARAFTDLGAMTGGFPGIGGYIASNILKLQNKSKSKNANLVIKAFTTFFPGLMGRMTEFVKDLTIFSTIGPPVNAQANGVDWTQGVYKTAMAAITSGVNYEVLYKNGKVDSVRTLSPHQRRRQMAKFAFSMTYTLGALAMLKWTKCSEESEDWCFEPRNKDFRINGGGVRYEDASDNWKPYTIQTKNENGEWEDLYNFQNNLVGQVMFAPLGYMYDRYYQKAVKETNTSINPGMFMGLVAAPFKNMWDNNYLQMFNPVTKVLNFATGAGDEKVTAKGVRQLKQVLAKALVTPLQVGGNMFVSFNSIYQDALDLPPQISKFKPDSEVANYVADRLASNLLFSSIIGKDDMDALGLKKVREYDVSLIPNAWEKSNLDDIDYLTADEKRLVKAVARYENDGRITPKYPRSEYTKKVSFNEEESLKVISDVFTLGETINGRNEISEAMKDFLLQRIDQVERSDVKQFREAIDKQFGKYQGIKEGMMLVAKLSPLLVEKGYGSLEGNDQIMTESDNPNGLGKIKWADPNKIVDYMVNNGLKYEGGKIVKFNYKPYVKEK